MKKRGARGKCTKEMTNRICDFIRQDDYTVKEICEMVDISQSAYYGWKETNMQFLEAVKNAELDRLENFRKAARKGLMMLLKGHEYREVTTEWAPGKVDADGTQGSPVRVSEKVVKKFIMPNPAAVIFTLKNTDPEYFREIRRVNNVDSQSETFPENSIQEVKFYLPENGRKEAGDDEFQP